MEFPSSSTLGVRDKIPITQNCSVHTVYWWLKILCLLVSKFKKFNWPIILFFNNRLPFQLMANFQFRGCLEWNRDTRRLRQDNWRRTGSWPDCHRVNRSLKNWCLQWSKCTSRGTPNSNDFITDGQTWPENLDDIPQVPSREFINYFVRQGQQNWMCYIRRNQNLLPGIINFLVMIFDLPLTLNLCPVTLITRHTSKFERMSSIRSTWTAPCSNFKIGVVIAGIFLGDSCGPI